MKGTTLGKNLLHLLSLKEFEPQTLDATIKTLEDLQLYLEDLRGQGFKNEYVKFKAKLCIPTVLDIPSTLLLFLPAQ